MPEAQLPEPQLPEEERSSERPSPHEETRPAGPPALSPPPPIRWRVLLAVLFVALTFRVFGHIGTPLIGADSLRFLAAAEMFENGQFRSALSQPYHPLTAASIAASHSLKIAIPSALGLDGPSGYLELRNSRERAASILMIACGVLVVWGAMEWTRWLFPRVSPAVVGLLAASQPYWVRSSVDVMSDMLFLAVVVWSLREAVRGAATARLLPAAIAGGLAGLAYLARPEGLLLAGAVPLYLLLASRGGWGRRIGQTSLFAVTLVAIVAPYIVAISTIAGEPTLTLKKDVGRMVPVQVAAEPAGSTEPAGESSAATGPVVSGEPTATASAPAPVPFLRYPVERYVEGAGRIFERWFSTSPEVIAIAFFFGLWVAWTRRREAPVPTSVGGGRWLIGGMVLPLVGILLLLIAKEGDPGYLSRRHVFLLVLFTLPLATWGLEAFARGLGAVLLRDRAPRARLAFPALILAGTVISLGTKGALPQRHDQLAQREAAEWILEELGPGLSIFTDREKVAYYAGGEWRPFEKRAEKVLAAARRHPRSVVAFYDDKVICAGIRDAVDAPGSGFRPVGSWAEKRKRSRNLLVYVWEQPKEEGR